MLQTAILSSFILLAVASFPPGILYGQAPVTCPCTQTQDFGSCLVGAAVSYRGEFPGSATVASFNEGGKDFVYLYVAGLYDGDTYVYDGTLNAGVLDPLNLVQILRSPQGSSVTTGIAFHPDQMRLYWCIGDQIFRTNTTLGDIEHISSVPLDVLKTKLGLLDTPSLGGITYHAVRDLFWAVDIVNDIYFEFDAETGTISEDGARIPIHFKNPKLSPYGGGAYGNSIAYVNLEGESFFDIPVGLLIDGRVVEVVRVHASEGGEGEAFHRIGDPTGVSYAVATGVGTYSFISGIAYWPMACSATDHTEILLDIRPPDSEERSSILQVSVDDPKSTSLIRFASTAIGSDVQLSWTPGSPYQSLEIKRRKLPEGALFAVKVFSDVERDPREYIDEALPDGFYEYEAQVIPPVPGRKLPPARTRVNIGQGLVVAFAPFRLDERPDDREPFAITYVDSQKEILVVDRSTGWAHRYGTDLHSKGSFAGPFIDELKLGGGMASGIAFDPDRGRLAWVLQSTDGCYIQETDLLGSPVGIYRPLQVPANLHQAPFIAGISYDPVAKTLWGVDLVNMVAYSFDFAGNLTGVSSTAQIDPPPSPDSQFIGGIAVVQEQSTAGKVTVDLVVGNMATDEPQQLLRRSYNRSDTTLVPSESDADVQIGEVLQSVQIGGLVAVVENGIPYDFIVGSDTGTIYKLEMRRLQISRKKFHRGDANGDGRLDISDGMCILNVLYLGGDCSESAGGRPVANCLETADANNDGSIDCSDPIFILGWLFMGTMAPPFPGPPTFPCGIDPDASGSRGDIGCKSYVHCQ